ncbi:hypothetical protein EYF80_032586 [Liparis tanakae]|uniref:Uncharacterized protein n=1 Tax=Liparis tanakae TaxID=230148 RepID=A0A4Z2GUG1_9TELE|nr:hypothetical protein EYF80_032586 [Liparis tanakae]
MPEALSWKSRGFHDFLPSSLMCITPSRSGTMIDRTLFSLSLVHAKRGSTSFSWSSNARSVDRK